MLLGRNPIASIGIKPFVQSTGAIRNVESITCPACGGANEPAAVFCANESCHKALGEFAYVLEELARDTSRIAKVAERVARLSGRPDFVTFHVFWFAAWVVLNSMVATAFDAYPYSLLGIVLSVEGLLITLFLLVSDNHQNAHADKRAALDYEVNVRTWRLVNQLADDLKTVNARLDRVREPGRTKE